jgi:uncharacterized membrane protein
MKEWVIHASEHAIVVIDMLALVIVVYASIEAFVRALPLALTPGPHPAARDVWLRYARWLVAALTFQLAADIVETSITTSWEAVGRIAAIAVIRTFLNYFLERDLAEVREREDPGARLQRGAAE